MNAIPPYYRQDGRYNCSLASLRMVLAAYGIAVSEEELVRKVQPEYGAGFTNLWNSTIAKLACRYGIDVTVYALWPIFKRNVLENALREFRNNPDAMDYQKYEHPGDTDVITESARLSYSEMFIAMDMGCGCVYGSLTKERMRRHLERGHLIQTSIRLHKLYPGMKHVFHSILLYGIDGDTVHYHDPAHGERLSCPTDALIGSMQDVGAGMVYRGLRR